MDQLSWYNQPDQWSVYEKTLSFKTHGKTDFWRITHYDFIRDNGHFMYQEQEGDFLASLSLRGAYQDLYDQAGMMIRLDEKNWMKTGIEFVEGVQQLSAVVTREFSDWSITPLPNAPEVLHLKLLRQRDFVQISYSLDGSTYEMLRLAYFPPNLKVQIGMMAASPEGNGFEVEMMNFTLTQILPQV